MTAAAERFAAKRAQLEAQAEALAPPTPGTVSTPALIAATGGSLTPRNCKTCAAPLPPVDMTPPPPPGEPEPTARVWAWLGYYCDECLGKARRARFIESQDARRQGERERIARLWAKFGPEDADNSENAYRDVDPAKLAPKLQRLVADWHPSGRKGLLIFGDTATQKTYTAYAIAKRLILEAGILPMLWQAPALRHRFNAAARSSNEDDRPALLRKLSETRVLIIDDLGQAASTEAAEEALWEVVEHRTAARRPMIITTQFAGEKLLQKFKTRETGASILRRIGQHTEPVNTDHR